MQDNSISLIVYYEIPEKNLIVYGMVFPFLTSIAVVLMILGSKVIRTLAFTQVLLGGLFIVVSLIFLDVIVLDNYISKHITLNSWMNVNETI